MKETDGLLSWPSPLQFTFFSSSSTDLQHNIPTKKKTSIAKEPWRLTAMPARDDGTAPQKYDFSQKLSLYAEIIRISCVYHKSYAKKLPCRSNRQQIMCPNYVHKL